MKDKNGPMSKLMTILSNQEIIEAFGYAVSLQDKNFKIIYQNKMAKKIIGNHIGKFCYQVFEHTDSVCDNCPLALSYKDGKVHTVEKRNPHKQELVFEITSSVIKSLKGEIIAGIEVLKLELKDTLKKAKTLKGFLPICASCNKIRDKKNKWTNVDVYIRDHSEAEITHGYCPECYKTYFPTDDKNVY
jgi:hypothetical protein